MGSVGFLILMTIPLLATQALPARIKLPGIILFTFNLLFLLLILDFPAFLYLGLFLGASYGILLATRKYRHAPFLLPVAILVLMFAVFKRYEFLPFQLSLRSVPEILGLSFAIFRVIAVLFEVHDRSEVPSPLFFLNYTVSMFTFLSGPIQRYRIFKEDMARWSSFVVSDEIMAGSLNRLFNGIIKVVFVAPPFHALQLFFWKAAHITTPIGRLEILVNAAMGHDNMKLALGYGLACFFYLPFLYFNFAGYTDIVIALGRMAGFDLPENFDCPFHSESFLDFWNRWHISLSLWFRDYCFTPTLKEMLKRRVKDPIVATLPAYFICFGLLGLWHGRTWPFMLCGLMFSVASMVNYAYRSLLLRSPLLSTDYKRISGGRLYLSVSSRLTLFYIGLAVAGFWLTGPEMLAAWSAMTAEGTSFAFTAIVVCLACVLYTVRLAYESQLVMRLSKGLVYLSRDWDSAFVLGAKTFIILCWFFVISSNVPDFVYKGF